MHIFCIFLNNILEKCTISQKTLITQVAPLKTGRDRHACFQHPQTTLIIVAGGFDPEVSNFNV